MLGRFERTGHSLLETIVAAGIFVLISVALSGVWVMYGNAMSKSGEHLAANHLARGFTEGLVANGYEWLESEVANSRDIGQDDYSIVRRVRGKSANIQYNILYQLYLDPYAAAVDEHGNPLFSADLCRIRVQVRWHSKNGAESIEDGKYNNSVSYNSIVYKGAT